MKRSEKYRPASKGYVSEFGQFIHDCLARHPDAGQERRRGWNIWWDQRADLDELD